jgi:hypothetical protein
MAYKQWIITESCWRHTYHGDIAEDDLISLTKAEYSTLMESYKIGGKEFVVVGDELTVRDQNIYAEEWYNQQETNASALQGLTTTDWKVIRELEKLYLAGTDLHTERQTWRDSVVAQTIPATSETP